MSAPLNKDIPVIVLCGGQGTRIRDAAEHIPKPMLQIGGYPILWHIMKIYTAYGYRNFILALGYKSWVVKEYFLNYRAMTSDFALDFGAKGGMHILDDREPPDWNIVFAETGELTQTGERVFRCRKYVETGEFMVTYGDGVADIDLAAEIAFHKAHGKRATVTAVRPAKRFGAIAIEGDRVAAFHEKPDDDGGWINGGFFLLSPSVCDTIVGDRTAWEREPMERLAAADELRAYVHSGFWHPMDTIRDRAFLEEQWSSGRAKWRVW